MGLNYNPTIVPDGLVMYLDPANSRSYSGSGNTWYDLSGNSLNATLVNSPSYTTSNIGTFVLDGRSNYFTLPNNSILSLSEFTISIWVKTLQLNADQYLVDTSSNLNYGYGYSFRIRSNNTIRFWAYDANTLLDTTATVNSNTWYNIVVSYSNFSKTQKIYINGELSASNQHTNSFVLADVQYLRIGNSQVLGGYTKGVVGQTHFYNRELSSSEVLQNYNATKGRYISPENIVTNGLVLNIDPSKSNSYSGFGNTIYDLSGFGSTGTLTNGPTFSGINGGSIFFDGTNDSINISRSNALTSATSLTVQFWVYLLQGANTCVRNSDIAWLFEFGTNANNAPASTYPQFFLNTSNGQAFIYGNSAIGTSVWKNCTGTYTAGSIKMYIDGALFATSTASSGNGNIIYSNGYLNLGYIDGETFNGNIAQVQIYNRALTQQEVLQNYNATKSRFGL
jgi:hypothetical protein